MNALVKVTGPHAGAVRIEGKRCDCRSDTAAPSDGVGGHAFRSNAMNQKRRSLSLAVRILLEVPVLPSLMVAAFRRLLTIRNDVC